MRTVRCVSVAGSACLVALFIAAIGSAREPPVGVPSPKKAEGKSPAASKEDRELLQAGIALFNKVATPRYDPKDLEKGAKEAGVPVSGLPEWFCQMNPKVFPEQFKVAAGGLDHLGTIGIKLRTVVCKRLETRGV